MNIDKGIRTYDPENTVVFFKTHEKWGEFSNMAPKFPLIVNRAEWKTPEALYQACRFPHLPDVQRLILDQSSPMTAKMKSKVHRSETRDDWENIRVEVMKWVLKVKLSQHFFFLEPSLRRTGKRAIVEKSFKDQFWGAIPNNQGLLCGQNTLGRLLMDLRDEVSRQSQDCFQIVEPPAVSNFRLLGIQVGKVSAEDRNRFSHSLF